MLQVNEYKRERVDRPLILGPYDIDRLLMKRRDNEPISFENCVINEVNFDGINFDGCDFRNCKLYESSFENCSFKNCNFEGASLIGLAHFNNCDFKFANFREAYLSNLVTHSTDFSNASFLLTNIRSCSFRDNTKFHGTDFLGTNINEAYFFNVDVLEPKNVQHINITMGGATNKEVERHAHNIIAALTGKSVPREKCQMQHVKTNLKYCQMQMEIVKAMDSVKNLQPDVVEEMELGG